jgi:hypothetical protein
VTQSAATADEGDDSRLIADSRYIEQLNEIFKLKKFLFEEKVALRPERMNDLDLGALNNLRYSAQGRSPTDKEWKLLDEKLSNLSSLLDPGLRQRLKIRELSFFFGAMPLTFLLITAAATIGYSTVHWILPERGFLRDICYFMLMVIWTIAQGGLGACAYLGIQATIRKAPATTPADILKETFEITDVNVLKIRIILGALFAFILGLSVTFPALNNIYDVLSNRNYAPTTKDIAIILVPFLLGFSTNLVLAILDRLVEAVRTFFGISSTARPSR